MACVASPPVGRPGDDGFMDAGSQRCGKVLVLPPAIELRYLRASAGER
jgi:hypothetical protein